MNDIALLAEDGDMVNITPTLLRFGLKFLLIFAVVAVVAVLTPRMANTSSSTIPTPFHAAAAGRHPLRQQGPALQGGARTLRHARAVRTGAGGKAVSTSRG